MTPKVKTAIKIGFSILILGMLFSFFDFSEVNYKNIIITPLQGLYIFLLLIVSLSVRAWRWQIIINENRKEKFSFFFSLKFLFIGSTLNIVLPAGGGDIAKSYFAYKEGGNKEDMLVSSIYDKLIAIASMFFLSIYAYTYTQNIWIFVAGVVASIPWALVHLFPYFSKISVINKVTEFINSKTKRIDIITFLAGFHFRLPTIFFSFILSIIGWVFTYFLLYYCFLISGLQDITINEVLKYSPILTLARLFPLTFNGIGSDEAVITFLFKNYNSQLILLGSIVYRVIVLFIPALIGLFFINRKPK